MTVRACGWCRLPWNPGRRDAIYIIAIEIEAYELGCAATASALRSTPAAPDPVADVLLVRERDQPQPDAVLREALTDIRDTTLDQPAAVNVPDEDWYRRLLLRAMGIARAALRSTPAAPKADARSLADRITGVIAIPPDGEVEP